MATIKYIFHIIMDVDPDQLDDYSPEAIAHALFSEEPKDPGTHMILALQEGSDLTYVFEILITILMEAMDIFAQGLENADLKNFSTEHITILEPWFKSLGFSININVYDKSEKEKYESYYCKIMVKSKPYDTFFAMKNILKNYHFLLNGNYLEQNRSKTNLKDLKAVFINVDDKVYEIGFEMINVLQDVPKNKIL